MTNGGGFEGVLKKRNSRKNSKPNAKAVLLNIGMLFLMQKETLHDLTTTARTLGSK